MTAGLIDELRERLKMQIKSVPVTGIHLFRIGDYVVVNAEVDGQWLEVIRERHDGMFSHIVETGGILNAPQAGPLP